MNQLLRIWFALKGAGWFIPSFGAAGGLLPFPLSWQAWLMFAGYLIAIAISIYLPPEPAWICRIGLTAAYIGVGILTYE